MYLNAIYDIAMIQGNATLSIELERNSSAYKDSLYKFRRNIVTNKIIKAETDAQTMLQKLYYKWRLNTYLCVFILIIVIIIIITIFLYKRYRRKNYLLQKDKQQIEKAHQDLSQHYARALRFKTISSSSSCSFFLCSSLT